MTKKKTPAPKMPPQAQPTTQPDEQRVEETPFEALASICSVLVVGLFILTFLGQNFVIPSGSMEKTLLVGDHLVVDRITLSPPTHWMPLVHYREPKRGDIIVFLKPVPDMVDGQPVIQFLVKRLVGVPGDHIHLRNGIVIINGVAQSQPHAQPTTPENHQDFLDEFPSVPPDPEPGNYITEAWAVDISNHIVDGDLVVPPGKYFMMGDNRHNSADSRFWGFVPRENIIGRPLFNYWSFETPEDQYEQSGMLNNLAWMGHVALHFFTETRWTRTLHRVK
ncbi:MAG: signal peptidase I [Terracidiphilus sp.]|jgi:signal peptidase I